MNRKEWLECDIPEIKWYWRSKCEEIRKTLKYNQNPNATHKHHLFDTPEQIAYNNEHYELWGFNEDGTFEYGKYIIFVTPEEHNKLHSVSELTKQRIRDNMPDRHSENNPMYGKHWSDEDRLKISESMKNIWNNSPDRKLLQSEQMTGEGNPMYGKPGTRLGVKLSEEAKHKISATHTGKCVSDETRKKLSDSHAGITLSDNAKCLIGIASKERWSDDDYRNKVSKSMSDSWTDERRKSLSNMQKGVPKSPEHIRKISDATKVSWTDERREQARINNTGENNPMYGKILSDEHKLKISAALKGRKTGALSKEHRETISKNVKSRMIILKEAYHRYKESGGEKKWNEFQKLDFDYIKSLISDSDIQD